MAFQPEPPMANEQLQKLRDAAQAKGAPLGDDEREVVLYGKVQKKIKHGIPVL